MAFNPTHAIIEGERLILVMSRPGRKEGETFLFTDEDIDYIGEDERPTFTAMNGRLHVGGGAASTMYRLLPVREYYL
jgi:hypothetical protein